jgi:hypothetical protein
MEPVTLLEKINSFPRWHYEFDLAGFRTPIFDSDHINRHEQRKGYFFNLCSIYLADLSRESGFWIWGVTLDFGHFSQLNTVVITSSGLMDGKCISTKQI